jgi:hypothetical protein
MLMEFSQICEADVIWDALRSVPLIVLFVGAVWFWARKKRVWAMVCALVGALTSTLLVRPANTMASVYNPSCQVTIVNVVTTSMLQILLVAYLGTEAEWSNWKVDLGLGSMAGISLALARGLAVPGLPWIGIILHSMALAAAGVLVLLLIRKLKDRSFASTLAAALLLAVTVTLFARAMGYRFVLE